MYHGEIFTTAVSMVSLANLRRLAEPKDVSEFGLTDKWMFKFIDLFWNDK